MRRDSLLGTQSPLTYAAQDGQPHPEVIRLLTAVVVAKSAAAVNKFPSHLEDYHTLLTCPAASYLRTSHPLLCWKNTLSKIQI